MKGTYTALVTPFSYDGINIEKLKELKPYADMSSLKIAIPKQFGRSCSAGYYGRIANDKRKGIGYDHFGGT